MKMEKTPRYTQRERNMVLGYAAQYKDIIENKRTDAESNRKKDEVWRQIAKEFNARVYHQRSSKQLRQLYKNMKLLLKKDLCGEGKGNRTFMDLLNTISQQESVAQYISEQMSPNAYCTNGNGNGNGVGRGSGGNGLGSIGALNIHNIGSHHHQEYNDDYDDSTHQPLNCSNGMDTDIIVIKSEDISDNENDADMDDDDDDCLSTKDIPEVCLEEEDEEIFATDLRQPNIIQQQQQLQQSHSIQKDQHLQKLSIIAKQQQSILTPPLPQASTLVSSSVAPSTTLSSGQSTQSGENSIQDVNTQNMGSIRVGSIGSLANMKALQTNDSIGYGTNDNSNLPLSLCQNAENGNNALSLREMARKQQLQLLNGLGLSAVQATVTTTTSSVSIPSTIPSQTSQASSPTITTLSTSTSCRSSSGTLLESIAARLPALQRVKDQNCSGNSGGGIYLNGPNISNLQNTNANVSNTTQQLLLNINGIGSFNSPSMASGNSTIMNNRSHYHHHQQHQNYNHHHSQHHYQREHQSSSTCNHLMFNRSSTPHNCNNNNNSKSNNHHTHNDYFMLGLEERKLKIELLNAQIEYWKKLTKKLDENPNGGLLTNPACMCHFPGKTNYIPTPASTS